MDIPLEQLFANAQKRQGDAPAAVATDGGDAMDGGDDACDPRLGGAADPIPTVQLEHDPNAGPRDIEVHRDDTHSGGGDDDDNNVDHDDYDDDADGFRAALLSGGAVAAVAGGAAAASALHEGPPPPPDEAMSRGVPSGDDGTTTGLSPEDVMEQGRMMKADDESKNGRDDKPPPSSSAEAPPPVPLLVGAPSESKKTELSPTDRPYHIYVFRAIVIIAVLAIVIVSAITISGNGDDTGTTSGGGVVVTASPTGSALPPTSPPSDGSLTTDFVPSSVFVGDNEGDRFGTVVSLTSPGDFMAVLSFQSQEPVRTFRLTENGLGWLPSVSLPPASFPPDGASSARSSRVDDVDAATTSAGTHVVAVSSPGGAQAYEYDEETTAWKERGQPLLWTSPEGAVQSNVSRTAVALSYDGSILALGYVSEDGDAIIARVFAYDLPDQQWTQLGGPIGRFRPPSWSPFVSLSLALSGDGRVVTIGDWVIGGEIEVKSYEMDTTSTDGWTVRGAELTYGWGPVAVALSYDGQKLATAAPAPGSGSVYEWDGTQWTQLGSPFPGGSSVAMNDGGLRVLVGDPLFSMATVVDYREGEGWTSTSELTGTLSSRFGSSVSISSNGNTLAIGSPLEDQSGQGQAAIYE